MPGNDSAGLPSEAFLIPGTSSFTEFLSAHRPGLLPTAPPFPPGVRVPADRFPHGTTVLARPTAVWHLRTVHAPAR